MSEPEPQPPRAHGARLLIMLFLIYVLLLAWIVLWKLEPPYVGAGALRHVKLVPFVAVGGDGVSKPVEFAANALLFVPFGLYLRLLVPAWGRWRAVGTVAAASLLLEVAQYVLAVGSTDVTDLILNTAGGLAGVGLFGLVRRRLGARSVPIMVRVCSVGTVIGVLLIVIFVASPIRYAQPRDPVTFLITARG